MGALIVQAVREEFVTSFCNQLILLFWCYSIWKQEKAFDLRPLLVIVPASAYVLLDYNMEVIYVLIKKKIGIILKYVGFNLKKLKFFHYFCKKQT